jgi:hypothetical protein
MDNATVYALPGYLRVNGLDGKLIEADAAWDTGRNVSLSSARNQAISFQIIIEPDGGKFTDCKLADTYPDTSFYIEWFHRYRDRLVPDMLIPLTDGGPKFSVPMDNKYMPDQRVGALYADIWIPADASPGVTLREYAFNIDGKLYRVDISLDINELVVPNKSRITADLNNYADSLSPHFNSLRDNPARYADGSYVNVERGFYRMAREHKCLFHYLPYRHSGAMPPTFAPELTGEGKYIEVASWEAFDRHFGPYLDGSAFDGCRFGNHPLEFMYLPFHLGWPASYEKWGSKGYRTEYRRILQAFVKHFEEKKWFGTYFEVFLNHKKDYRFFPYTVDEIWYEHDQDIVDIYYDIIRDIYDVSPAKFVFRMDSSNYWGSHHDHRFSDYCKMWVAGFGMFNWYPKAMEIMNAKKNIVFVYGGVLQTLDESLNSLFLWPLQTMMTGAHGFTAWNTTGFGTDPLSCPVNGGGEALFYPGTYFGIEAPLPSIRLKTLRNAMQLTDLVMARKASRAEGELMNCINRAYGLKGMEDWYVQKPAFADTPPRYWDFGEVFQNNTLPDLSKGNSYDFTDKLTRGLYGIMAGNPSPVNDGVVFSYH